MTGPGQTGGVTEALTLSEDKKEARRQVRARRRERAEQTTPEARERHAAKIRNHAAPLLDQLPAGAVVTSFVARPTEVPTHLLNDDVRRRGLDLILPVVLDDFDLDWSRPDQETPLGVDIIGAAALVILPALAIATDGMRLGQGGGCYDHVLQRVPREVPRVALVHDDEVVPQVPIEPHDRPVDAAISAESGLQTFATWQESTLRN